jgi:hypothetical protein
MSAEFDPYHKLLGIAPREQPPDHYRLLGVDTFEDDPEVIEASANRQMTYLQGLASGPNVEHVQQLLNEVSRARVCLLDIKQKTAYDSDLQDGLEVDTVAMETESTLVDAPAAPRHSDDGKLIQPPPPPAAIRTSPFQFEKPVPTESATIAPRSKKASVLISTALIAVVCLVLIAAVAVTVADRTPDDSNLLSGTGPTPSDSQPDARPRAANEEISQRKFKGKDNRGADPKRKSDIPTPGAYVKDEPKRNDFETSHPTGTAGSDRESPNHGDDNPFEQNPKSNSSNENPDPLKPLESRPPELRDMPDQVAAAHAALVEGKLELMIDHLEEYLQGDTTPRWRHAAIVMLDDALFVTSDEEVSLYIAAELDEMTDSEVTRIANGADFFQISGRRYGQPVLQKAFRKTVERNLPDELLERLER